MNFSTFALKNSYAFHSIAVRVVRLSEIYCKTILGTNGRFFSDVTTKIQNETVISTSHLTPEIKLHLLTPECNLWYKDGHEVFQDPFWAFYWPGGQVVSRYLLDNPKLAKKNAVLDFGCGGGACGLSALICGAEKVIFNDIDEVALACVLKNAELNNAASYNFISENLIGSPCNEIDVILVGDMLYDTEFSNQVLTWLQDLSKSGKLVLIGDPGRFALESHPLKNLLKCVAKYRLPPATILENNGHVDGFVWTFKS